MAVKPLLLDETGQKIADALNLIAVAQGGAPDFTSWQQIKTAVANGYGPRYFPVGTQLLVNHGVYGSHLFDVVAHNYLKSVHDPNAPTMTLVQHDLLPAIQYDVPEAFYFAETELAAGTYNFTIETYGTWTAGAYQFTLTQAVPTGGQLCVSGQYPHQGNITGAKVYSYSSRLSTNAIESSAITQASSGTSLGTCGEGTLNHVHRIAYGSNNYKECAPRQFLNSSAAAGSVWAPQTKFDRPPTWVNSLAGYMSGLDPEFLAVVGEVVLPCSANSIYEAPDSTVTKGTAYTLNDKFYLASRAEIFGTYDVNDGSVLLPFYEGASDADRIKYREGSAANWWLRTPFSLNAVFAHLVGSDGTMGFNDAFNAVGLAPACTIV